MYSTFTEKHTGLRETLKKSEKGLSTITGKNYNGYYSKRLTRKYDSSLNLALWVRAKFYR